MLIDFHTHIFPEAIAEKTILGLAKRSGMTPYTNGTMEGLKASMKEAGVDISVVLPVVTKSSQFRRINEFAADITKEDGIISFGGIHPESTNYKEELKFIKSLGLKGIKLHPDYQGVFFDDKRYVHIVDYATELGLYSIVHAGIDIGFPEIVHCTPKHASNLLNEIGEKKLPIIFAHTGGWKQWDDVERYLVGRDVYFDISFSLGIIKDEQFLRIVKNHTADKLLFGTDSPWSSPKDTLDRINKMSLTEEEKEKIFYKNAMKILQI